MRVRNTLLFVFLAITMVLSACGGAQTATTTGPGAAAVQPSTETPAEPVVLKVGYAGSPDTLNPGTAVLSEAYTMFELVYDSMYDLQLDGSFTLSLADNVDVSDDGLVYTYHIRDGVKFHDGTPLTAEDVAFSYNFYKTNEDFPYMNPYTYYIDTVEATPNNEAVLTLTEAIPNIESQLVFMYILPKHIWEGVSPTEYENTEMIGSGPFKMVEYKQNEFVHLAANKDYYLGAPKIDEIIFQTFENQDALVQAIKTGQVDMITEMPNTAVAALKNTENVQVVIGAPFSPEVTDIIFNQCTQANCPTDAGGVCSGHPALQDRNLRLALAYATDKQKIIDVVLLGLGTPGLTLIPDGLGVWYNNTIKDYPYDVAKANQILDDAGYKDADGDGIRDMPDGSRPLTFRLNWPSDSITAPRMAELLGEMWGQVGVSLEPQAADPDALTAQCCPTFDFDIIIWGWGSDPDPNLLLGVMTSEQIPTGSSETGYSNPEYDELYKKQATAPDFETRKDIVWTMQQIAFDDVVYIIPFYAQATQAYRTDRFTGWVTDQPKVALEDPTSLTVIEAVKK